MSLWNQEPQKNITPGMPSEDLNKPLSAGSTKCPNCASNIFFEPEINALLCRNCGGVFDPDSKESIGSFCNPQEHNYTGDGDMTEEDKLRRECICDACGAVLVTDVNTASTFCPFCGSPALIKRKLSREFKPDKIVPFKIDRQRAEELFTKYIDSKTEVAKNFKTKKHLKKMTALYVPFWLVSGSVETHSTGTGRKWTPDTDSVEILEVNSKIKFWVKGIPFDASKKIANKLMEAIEPYDYSEMVDFAPEYLQGFYADSYDQLPTDMMSRIAHRLKLYSFEAADSIKKDYNDYVQNYDKAFNILRDIRSVYCLMPVWFLNIEVDGTSHQFAVNGQTGEVCGQLPDSTKLKAKKGLLNFYGKHRGYLELFFILIGIVLIVARLPLMFALATGALSTALYDIYGNGTTILGALLIAFVLLTEYFVRKHEKQDRTFTGDVGAENELDKMPPLAAYYDPSMKTTVETNDILLRHYMQLRDNNGRVVDTKEVDIF